MWGIILGIVLFLLLILFHEFGHFIFAKKSGVKVLEFGIGIPPKIKKLFTDKSGTKYTLNLIPLGGFVRLKGEDPSNKEEFNAPDSFVKAKLHKKILILIAGVLMNFLIAWFLFFVVFAKGTKPISIIPDNISKIESESYLIPTIGFLQEKGFVEGEISKSPAIVSEILDDSPASKLGLKNDDIIKGINGENVNSFNLQKILKSNIGKNIEMKVFRDGKMINFDYMCPEDNCVLGVMVDRGGNLEIKEIKYVWKDAIFIALHEIKAQTKLTFNVLGKLGSSLISFNGKKIKDSLNSISGPVGAVKFGDELLKYGGWLKFLAFAGMISLALAILNILPIPALDGGRLLGVLIQAIGRLKIEKYFQIESYINLFFFILLMGLGVYIILKDLVRFWDVNISFLN